MITQIKISDFKYQIEEICNDSPSSATWINRINILSAIFSIVLIPFTAGASLFILLGIVPLVLSLDVGNKIQSFGAARYSSSGFHRT